MFKNRKLIIIIILGASLVLGLLYFFGINPISNRDSLDDIGENILQLNNDTQDLIGFQDLNSPGNQESEDFELVDLAPLLVSQSDDYNFLQIDLSVENSLDSAYLRKIAKESSDEFFLADLGFIRFENPIFTDFILFQDKKTGEITTPPTNVSDLFEFEYQNVKYWLYSTPGETDLYISLENFENPRQILLGGRPLNAFEIKEQSNGVFWITSGGEDRIKRLVNLDFNKIPFDKWSDLDFLDERLNSLRMSNSADLIQLENDIASLDDNPNDDILEYNIQYNTFDYFVTENNKVILRVPGINNQYWLLDGERISLVKLDISFDSGDGLITCENSENICIVYFRDIGIYKIDLNDVEPTAENISPIINDSGDGIITKNILQSFNDLGRDSEKIIEYSEGKVFLWFDGARFTLGDFDS